MSELFSSNDFKLLPHQNYTKAQNWITKIADTIPKTKYKTLYSKRKSFDLMSVRIVFEDSLMDW